MVTKHALTLTWQGADSLRYNIYSSSTYPVDIEDPTNLLHTYRSETSYTISFPSLVVPCHYAITAIDRFGNESAPLQWRDERVLIVPSRNIDSTR